MNGKENYLGALLHKKTAWVPVEGEGLAYTGFEGNEMEKGPRGGGADGFGVEWTAPDSGGGTAMPVNSYFLLDEESICDWDHVIRIPNPADYHWEEDARAQLEGVDRETTAVDYGDGNGPFERLAALMGFENTLLAMALEPDAVESLLTAITDYKLECLEYIHRYYHPDTYTLYDDVATQNCPFMSPDTYRRLISPQHKRLADRAKELGMIPVLHCCGKAEILIEDFIREGFAAWASVQPCNDIVSILEKYGDQICIAGGYHTNGLPGTTDDETVIMTEVQRCFREYGSFPGYIFAGFILLPLKECGSVENVWDATGKLCEKAIEYAHSHGEYRL